MNSASWRVQISTKNTNTSTSTILGYSRTAREGRLKTLTSLLSCSQTGLPCTECLDRRKLEHFKVLPSLYYIRHIIECCTQGKLRVLDAWCSGRKKSSREKRWRGGSGQTEGRAGPTLDDSRAMRSEVHPSLIILTCEDKEDTNARRRVREERTTLLPAWGSN